MDKTAIKNLAMWARNKLKSDIKVRAGFMGITEGGIASPLPASTSDIQYFDVASSEPVKLQGREIEIRKRIVSKLEQHAKESGYQTAYDSLIENMASEWFNRLIAIRYMEVNDYFSDGLRMLSSVQAGKQDPDIVSRPFDSDLEFTDSERAQINDWMDHNKADNLFRFLILKRCNQLAESLPGLFEVAGDASEFFLRLGFVEKDGFVYKLVHDIEEDDWKDQVQIIGWMYQYYIAEKHDEIVNVYKSTVKKEDIPAATQLFTTDWVVRYMVDNSLGRYWIERHPESRLADKLQFFVKPKNGEIAYINEDVTPEEMTFLDDCMGSGHILVYAFDVLMEIYRERGYSDREAARSIVENNLYGLDIDDRCTQLAYFAVMMKARSYDGRFLTRKIEPHVLAIQESNGVDTFVNDKIATDKEMNQIGQYLIHIFKDAKELGSLVSVEERDYDGFLNYFDECINNVEYNLDVYQWQMYVLPVIRALAKQAVILSKRFVVVTTNPPYLNKMSGRLKKFVVDNYKDYSTDIFAAFVKRNFELCKNNGYIAYMTPNVWMFITSYEKLRQKIIDSKGVVTLVQMAKGAFFKDATVDICSFVLNNAKTSNWGEYFRLENYKGDMDVQKEGFLNELSQRENSQNWFSTDLNNFNRAPSHIFAYWVSESVLECFQNKALGSIAAPRQGMAPSDTNRFLRLWYEIGFNNIGFGAKDEEESIEIGKKWYPYNKGGLYRKWYGNQDYVVNWENGGFEVKEYARSLYKNDTRTIKNQQFYFKECVSWSKISSGNAAFRYYGQGFIFSDAGMAVFSNNKKLLLYIAAFLNSCVCRKLLEALSPTMNFEAGQIQKLPLIENEESISTVAEIVEECILLAKDDWDDFETSWYFKQHPLVRHTLINGDNKNISVSFDAWNAKKKENFGKLAQLEIQLNDLFINLYNLNRELVPSSEQKDNPIRKADVKREIKSLLSYAVGCMFGRYSLDVEGLVFAGGAWDTSKYSKFLPDEDNVIPITDRKYMDDDIVERLCEFLKVVYGEKSLDDNLDFIANALGNKGSTSKEIIRNYFLNDFFKDHCKIYQKRPIYWLFDSGKQNGFKALVYMHRWNQNCIGRVLVYLHKIQEKYEIEVRAIDAMLEHMTDKRQQAAEEKRRDHLSKQIAEIKEYDERLDHMANEHVDIDLDDGVKVNYEKVQIDRNGTKFNILATIK